MLMHSIAYQPSTSTVIVIEFFDGYSTLEDLRLLLNGFHGDRILRLLVDYCQNNPQDYYNAILAIIKLPSTNPDSIAGVDDMIKLLGMQVYKAFYNNRLFKPVSTTGYRFHKVMESGKLALIIKQIC